MTTDESIILSCAFRYALGRRTYVVSTIVNKILDSWDDIPQHSRDRFCKEIKEHEEMWDLGDNCDKAEWYKIIQKNKGE